MFQTWSGSNVAERRYCWRRRPVRPWTVPRLYGFEKAAPFLIRIWLIPHLASSEPRLPSPAVSLPIVHSPSREPHAHWTLLPIGYAKLMVVRKPHEKILSRDDSTRACGCPRANEN